MNFVGALRAGTVGAFRAVGTFNGLISRFSRALVEAVGSLIFPWSCAICGLERTGSPFCVDCRERLWQESGIETKLRCPRCALPVGPFALLDGGCSECRGHPLGFDEAIAFGPYDGALKDLCLRLKHERDAWLGPWLAEIAIEARVQALGSLPADTRVAPVPLHWSRRWQRGYNQSDTVARAIAKRLGFSFQPALCRVVATPKLASKGITERAEVMRGAFRARARARLEGKTVLLVDDVLTTGATCGAAARALKKAGASRVVVFVLARANKA
jgi:ComF family protein